MKYLAAIALTFTIIASPSWAGGFCQDAIDRYNKDMAEDDAKDTSNWAPGAKEANDKLNERIKANIIKGCEPGGFYDQWDEVIRRAKEECKAHPDKKGC